MALTTSKDVLEAIAAGSGPDKVLVTLGYSGWGAGQLEDEIGQNAWLTVVADSAVIFDTAPEARFAASLRLLGIDPANLTGQAGHA
jgi:putative transcriptional regulator